METWFIELIKVLTCGEWRQDETIFFAKLGFLKFVYVPLSDSKAEFVIRKYISDTPNGRWQAIKIFAVEPKDWTWVKKDAAQKTQQGEVK